MSISEREEQERIDERERLEEEVGEYDAISVQESLPEGFRSSLSHDEHLHIKRVPTVVTTYVKFFRLHAILTLGGILGVLLRKGLTVLSEYEGSYLTGVVWSNFTACVVMGFALGSERIWSELRLGPTTDITIKALVPLYVGITTGFCGSLSSFSSFVLEIFEKTSDLMPSKYYHYPNLLYGIMEFISVISTQMTMSVAGLQFGRHILRGVDLTSKPFDTGYYQLVEHLLVVLGVVGWIASIAVSGAVSVNREWSLSCVFAPLGVFARYHISKLLNTKIKDFPLGTFVCNLSGSILILIFNLLTRGKIGDDGVIVGNYIGCEVNTLLADGFCGCYTTVSTFAVELFGLRLFYAYRYGLVSIAVSFVCLLLIIGPYNWTQGLTVSVCL